MFRVKDTAFLRFASAGLPGICGLLSWGMAMCLKIKDYKTKDGKKESDLVH